MQIKNIMLINNQHIKTILPKKNCINSTYKIPIIENPKLIFNIRKKIGHFFSNKNNGLSVSSDIFVVKNNIIKDNTKTVTSKIADGSTSYNTKKILSQNPNSLSNIQKADIKKDLDYQLQHHQISQREYDQMKRKVNFTGNNENSISEDGIYIQEKENLNFDQIKGVSSSLPENSSTVSFDDISLINFDATCQDNLGEITHSSLDISDSISDTMTSINNNISENVQNNSTNSVSDIVDTITNNADAPTKIIKKIIEIFTDNINN